MKRTVFNVLFATAVFLAGCDLEDPKSLKPDEVFVKYYGGEGIDTAFDFVVNTTGLEVDSYVMFGSSDSYLLTEQTVHTEWVLIFTDSGGNLMANGIKRFPVQDLLPSLPIVVAGQKVECIPSRIKKAADGGYLLIGSIKYDVKTNGVTVKQSDMLVVKVDEDGTYDQSSDVKLLGAYRTMPKVPATNPVTYDTLIFDHFGNDIVEISEGYICVGTTTDVADRDFPNVGTNDFYLVKLNAALDTVWTKSDGTIADDFGEAVLSISGGTEIFVAISTKSTSVVNASSDFNAAMVKFPVTGSVKPENTAFIPIGSSAYDETVIKMVKLRDDDIFLTGNSAIAGGGATKPFLARITSNEVQLNSRIEVAAGVKVNDFYRTLGGRFVYAAETSGADDGGTNGQQILLMRTDDFGGATPDFGDATYSGHRYGGSGNDVANAIVQLPDGKFVMLITAGIDNNPQTVIGLMKTNKNGVLGK